MKRALLLSIALTAFAACSHDETAADAKQAAAEAEPAAAPAAPTSSPEDIELRETAAAFFEPIPVEPMLKGAAPDPAQVELGAMLYFDPRLSKSGIISCQTCHNVGMGGVDAVTTSIGHGWQEGPRNAPTVFNAVFNAAQFWDGRAADLKEQAKGPVQAGVEMNNTPVNVETTLKSMPGYVAAFETAFPDAAEPVSFDNMAAAIEAFEATLLTPHSPFDRFLAGEDDAMTEIEKRGLTKFIDTGCASCHMGVNFGGQDYFPFGVVEVPDAEVRPEGDHGRYEVTNTEDDDYVFRAAPLRNIALTAPYFHSGAVWDLEEAVAIMGVSQLGAELTEEDVADITAFLHTLTGEQPEVEHPVLPERGPDTPLPAAD